VLRASFEGSVKGVSGVFRFGRGSIANNGVEVLAHTFRAELGLMQLMGGGGSLHLHLAGIAAGYLYLKRCVHNPLYEFLELE
jgi:hypothetical protein